MIEYMIYLGVTITDIIIGDLFGTDRQFNNSLTPMIMNRDCSVSLNVELEVSIILNVEREVSEILHRVVPTGWWSLRCSISLIILEKTTLTSS